MSSHVMLEGVEKIMLGSNNYLGLSSHPSVTGAAQEALAAYGSASTGSRLLNGTFDLHLELERELADWHGTDDAVVFTTGYQANLGTVGCLLGHDDHLIVDERAHASIHDGCRLAAATTARFEHNDVDALRRQLHEIRHDTNVTMVVVDSLYSMDGDIAPLPEIAAVCREYGAALMVDEAHGVGIFGATRTGLAEHYGIDADVDIRMGSLSKALGSTGGFIAASQDIVDAVRARARAFLFTTSGSPATVGAALASIRLQRSPEGAERAATVLRNAQVMTDALRSYGAIADPGHYDTEGGLQGPVVPVHIGDDWRAIQVWKILFDRDIFVSVALHPAVPRTGALLRLCVTSSHQPEDLDRAAFEIARAVKSTAD